MFVVAVDLMMLFAFDMVSDMASDMVSAVVSGTSSVGMIAVDIVVLAFASVDTVVVFVSTLPFDNFDISFRGSVVLAFLMTRPHPLDPFSGTAVSLLIFRRLTSFPLLPYSVLNLHIFSLHRLSSPLLANFAFYRPL